VPQLLPRPRFRPDIEGLRAVAVLLVVAFHAGVPGLEGGFVGVDVFFVVSGYLITWLLVDEAGREGRIDLWRFYARRARRLVPALLVLLAVTAAVAAVLYAPMEQRDVARLWPLAALYLSNFGFADWAPDYHGPRAAEHPLLHTWSLGVEEQFYLVWPVLVGLGLGLWRRARAPHLRRLGLVLGGVTALSFVLSTALTYAPVGRAWAFYLSPARAWEFGVGALAVLIPVGGSRRAAEALGWGGLAGIAAAGVLFDAATPFPGAAALLPALATVAVLRAGTHGEAWCVRALSLRPLQWLGGLSYSWYLWHWPVLVFAQSALGPLALGGRVAAALTSLAPAWLSYRFVEAPVRYAPSLVGRPRRSLVWTIGATVALTALSLGWWRASGAWAERPGQAAFAAVRADLPQIYADGCDRYGEATLVECAYGDPEAEQVAVLVGDSHAGQLFPALRAATDAAGWRLVVYTLSACPFADVPVLYNEVLGRDDAGCVAWRGSALDAIAALRPDAVFVSMSNAYDLAPDVWAEGTRRTLSALAARTPQPVLVLDTPAAQVDVPACLAQAAWRPGTALDPDCRPRGFDAADRRRVDAQAAAGRSVLGVEVLDLAEAVCPGGTCGPRAGDLVRYRDGGHLSRAFAATLSPEFAPFLSGGG
jgi:peptidoglycan/LPS O-acetylase OafA/YrhL